MRRFALLLVIVTAFPRIAAAAERGSPCLMEPFQRVNLKSSDTSRVVSVSVDRGSVITKGQVLVMLDASVEQASLNLARQRATMESQIRLTEAKLENATNRFRRRDELVRELYVSQQDRDDSAADRRIAEAELREANDNRELARLEVLRLTAEIDRRTLISPFNGVVTERLLNPGEMAQVGETATTILKLAQIDPVRVELVLPLAKYGQVKPGQTISVRPEPPFEGSYRAVVKIVDKVVDAASGTFGVRLQIANPRGDVPVGVKCSVDI